jgi:hypothetical protein
MYQRNIETFTSLAGALSTIVDASIFEKYGRLLFIEELCSVLWMISAGFRQKGRESSSM